MEKGAEKGNASYVKRKRMRNIHHSNISRHKNGWKISWTLNG
jgi:hypothetical protein